MMILFESNREPRLQLVSGKFAEGAPQSLVLTVGLRWTTSEGTESSCLSQNHTLMKELVRSMAYHPPPLALKGGP